VITVVVSPAALAGDEFELASAAHHHLARVRRVAVGEAVRAVDGAGAARSGAVVAVERQRTVVRLGAAAAANEPATAVELLVAALRPERAEWLVEKATELGAAAVRFVATERTPREYGAGRLERMRRIAVAAVEQCHRARVPEISGVHPWGEIGALLARVERRHLLDASGEAAIAPAGGSLALLVGPEGGLTAGELEAARGWGCAVTSLGPRALRVETAALAGAVLALR
jgi:16S rRNA (uracil1498-N3)-methyltransferase